MTLAHSVLVWLPTACGTAVAMDLWSAFLHGRVWHHALWRVHRSHHTRRVARFEANDALSALHAPIAVLAILYGCRGPVGVVRELVFGAGVGMSAFGLAYVVVHDGLVHRRLPVAWLARVPYLRDVARAHRIHHAGVYGGPPYGLFFGPLDLARRHHLRPPPTRSVRRRAPTSPRSMGQGPG